MGSREISILTRSVGAKVPVRGQHGHVRTESTLETDFVLMCDFDPQVGKIESQPVTIAYTGEGGAQRHYTPDFLVEYLPDPDWVQRRRPELVETKYAQELEQKALDYALKFEAARQYAGDRGWTFRVISETDLRTPYLKNAKFLLPYIRRPAWHEAVAWDIRKALQPLGAADPRTLMAALSDDPAVQLRYLPHIWQLVAYRYIGADLEAPLNMKTALTYLGEVNYPLKKDWIHDRPF